MEPTTTVPDISFLADGTSIVDIVVNSTVKMATGLTQAISYAFDGLILNADKSGLSALAICAFTFMGFGFIYKVVLPKASAFFMNRV